MPENRRLFEAQSDMRRVANSLHALREEITFGSHETPSRKRVPTIEAHSYRALVRTVGYFKYQTPGAVLLRGQTETYGALVPSAYRGAARAHADAEVERLLQDIRAAGLVDRDSPVAAHSTEPLLQHYGIRTRWLDLVDSVPHALFFALNAQVESSAGNGMHTYVPSLSRWGYIYVLETGRWTTMTSPAGDVPGMWTSTPDLTICDLRAAKPSTALRPHAQHGLLCRGKRVDLWPLVIAHIAVPVRLARSWIGGAESLSREALFPPGGWDVVYGALLGTRARAFWAARSGTVDLGAITRFDFTG